MDHSVIPVKRRRGKIQTYAQGNLDGFNAARRLKTTSASANMKSEVNYEE